MLTPEQIQTAHLAVLRRTLEILKCNEMHFSCNAISTAAKEQLANDWPFDWGDYHDNWMSHYWDYMQKVGKPAWWGFYLHDWSRPPHKQEDRIAFFEAYIKHVENEYAQGC